MRRKRSHSSRAFHLDIGGTDREHDRRRATHHHAPQPKNWFDLAVGDCLTEIPAIDLGVVTATVVDCAVPHQAEVYLLAPLAVDTAIADVANRKCAEGFSPYTGQAVDDSPFTVTYLIDSNQDRTTNNPTPSTAICFVQAANGGPLTQSARR